MKDSDDSDHAFSRDSDQLLGQNRDRNSEIVRVSEQLEDFKEDKLKNYGAFNTTKHLWAGAVAAMVSRFFFFLC